MACQIVFADDQVLTPDTYVNATHGETAESTQSPIESGQEVTDHLIIKPRTLSLELIVGQGAGREDLQPPCGPDRPQAFYNRLSQARSKRQSFVVLIDGDYYSPAVLLSLSRPHTIDDGDAYQFTVQIQEILVATMQTVPLSALKAGLRHSGGKAKKGNVTPEQASAAVAAAAKRTMALLAAVTR